MLGRFFVMKSCAAQILGGFVLALLAALTLAADCHALTKGDKVEGFSLQDLCGATYALSEGKAPLTVLYFFDAQSRPSQEGILLMDRLVKRFKDQGLLVWGITRSAKDTVSDYAAKAKPDFPILLDTAGVGEGFGAKAILPAACVIGPDLKVIDFIQGGGKSMNTRLVKLTEARLKQKEPAVAEGAGKAQPEKGAGNEPGGSAKAAPARTVKKDEAKKPAPQASVKKSRTATQSVQAPGNDSVQETQPGASAAAPAESQADAGRKPIRWDKTFELQRQDSYQGGQAATPYSTAPQTTETTPQNTTPANEEGIFGRGRSIR